jgi:hypothetical protein
MSACETEMEIRAKKGLLFFASILPVEKEQSHPTSTKRLNSQIPQEKKNQVQLTVIQTHQYLLIA